MTMTPPTACRAIYCAEHAVERGYCVFHAKANPRVEKKLDRNDRLYHTKNWERFSALMRERNPICQAVIDGKQCRYPSKISHHLISPKVDMAKFLEPSNIVCLCLEHHPNTPGEIKPHIYTPTNGPFGEIFKHAVVAPLKKGEVRIGEGGVAEIG